MMFRKLIALTGACLTAMVITNASPAIADPIGIPSHEQPVLGSIIRNPNTVQTVPICKSWVVGGVTGNDCATYVLYSNTTTYELDSVEIVNAAHTLTTKTRDDLGDHQFTWSQLAPYTDTVHNFTWVLDISTDGDFAQCHYTAFYGNASKFQVEWFPQNDTVRIVHPGEAGYACY